MHPRKGLYSPSFAHDAHSFGGGILHFESSSHKLFTYEGSLFFLSNHHPFLQQFIWLRQASSFSQAFVFLYIIL